MQYFDMPTHSAYSPLHYGKQIVCRVGRRRLRAPYVAVPGQLDRRDIQCLLGYTVERNLTSVMSRYGTCVSDESVV